MTIIQHYEFGKIIIDGKIYTSDLKIISGKVVPNWWRKEGHKLYLEDIKDVINAHPKVLIIGCGANSVMEVSYEVVEYCRKNNIDIHILDSYSAVKLFNSISEKKENIAFCIHLTC